MKLSVAEQFSWGAVPRLLAAIASIAGLLVIGFLVWRLWSEVEVEPPVINPKHAPAHSGQNGGRGLSSETSVIGVDEVLVNLRNSDGSDTHYLGLKVELELFDEASRSLIEQRQSGIKHTLIEVARDQEFGRLSTISGKLYFKEILVSRLNDFFRQPVVKDIHFSSFTLQ
ncbi:MAG: flagellar basal body-associated FliL family protein [Deltaproteobacteria bacterium]|nr:flagellar basal body-associated FliL family protein [Deltaproteobacteria bacterium]